MTRLLLAPGVVGPVVFVLTFLVDGATRPGYDPRRNLVSQLATGEGGWVQIASFILCGVLVLAGAFGMFRTSGPSVTVAMVAGVGVALILAGSFVTDPGFGYPPGTLERRTLHGDIHGYVSIVAFLLLALAPLSEALRRRPGRRGWMAYSALSGLVVLAAIVASAAAGSADQAGTWPDAPGGVFQRISIIAGFGWLSAYFARALATRSAALQ